LKVMYMARAIESRSRTSRLQEPRILILAGVLLVAALTLVFLPPRTAQIGSVHRLHLVSPYRNTRPGVKYVGDAACIRCHAEIAGSYRQHPMGRSLAPIAKDQVTVEVAGDGRPLFESHGLQYSIEKRNGRVFHQETGRDASGRIVTRNEVEVQFVLGSASHGTSYLIERDGYLFESPITWYSQKRRWDISPGFETANYHFDRPIRPGCLYCHANLYQAVPASINHYYKPIFEGFAIGCERCHGPGELHATRPEVTAGLDVTIVNPANLEPSLRDAVCKQCHLMGDHRVVRAGRREEDYRPGLPFQQFWTVLVQPADQADTRFVGQFEQMHESKCFIASQGRLGCISCHDPHKQPAPDERSAYYRSRCIECHGDRGCSLPTNVRLAQSRDDDCTKCHMPPNSTSDIAHAATAEHRILRRQKGNDPPGSRRGDPHRPWRRPVPFDRALTDAGDEAELRRDLGVAMCRDGEIGAGFALPLLEAAVTVHPDDLTAWEAKAFALDRLGRDDESMAAFVVALANEPTRESALIGAAYLSVKMGRRADAADLWRRAIAVNPWRSDYHAELALVYFYMGNWRAAADACREALRLNPSWVKVRKWLARCYHQLGDAEAASKEEAAILDLEMNYSNPAHLPDPHSGRPQP
jgi:Flp pilus assembly protein TadD